VPRSPSVGSYLCSLLLILLIPAHAAATQTSRAFYLQTVLQIQQRIEQHDLVQARSLIESARAKFPADGGIENLLGVVEIQQGHSDAATQAFVSAIRHDPKLISAYLNLGRVYMQTAATDKVKRESALRLYEKLLRIDPGNPEANYQTATLLMWDGSYQRSLDHLAKLPADARNQVGTQILMCADEAALGHRQEADNAASALAANPDLTEQDALEVLPSLRSSYRADLIDKIFVAVNGRDPLSTDSLRTLGLAQEANGKLEQARATLEKAFSQNPSSVIPLIDLARVAKAGHDYQGALGYLAHARDLTPRDPSLSYEFGVICLKLELLGESRKAMQEAVQLAPDNAEYNLGMGIVSSFAQDPSGALPYLEKAHTLRPADPTPVLALGSTYFRAKNFDAAGKWLTQAATMENTAAEAHFYLGRIALQEGRLEDAAKELSQSDKLMPDRPDTLAQLGQVSLARKQYADAQKFLDRAIGLDKENYLANFALLQLYARTGDPRRAEESGRFDEIKDKNEEQYKQMMRIIEIQRTPPK
jgi:tetratricopeptide (TPR) repeat protein